jgi:prevent-host-death family protein
MIRISATKLRNNLFDYLDKAAAGETIIIQRNNQEVARLVAIHPGDWRERTKVTPQLLSTPEELLQPLDDIWVEYT